jgi:hypothetical protein
LVRQSLSLLGVVERQLQTEETQVLRLEQLLPLLAAAAGEVVGALVVALLEVLVVVLVKPGLLVRVHPVKEITAGLVLVQPHILPVVEVGLVRLVVMAQSEWVVDKEALVFVQLLPALECFTLAVAVVEIVGPLLRIRNL